MGKDKVEEQSRNGGKVRRIKGQRFTADWASVDAERIRDAIASATAGGGAIRFGYTRDGGAYAVGILGDGDPYTIYSGSGADVDANLQEIIDAFG